MIILRNSFADGPPSVLLLMFIVGLLGDLKSAETGEISCGARSEAKTTSVNCYFGINFMQNKLSFCIEYFDSKVPETTKRLLLSCSPSSNNYTCPRNIGNITELGNTSFTFQFTNTDSGTKPGGRYRCSVVQQPEIPSRDCEEEKDEAQSDDLNTEKIDSYTMEPSKNKTSINMTEASDGSIVESQIWSLNYLAIVLMIGWIATALVSTGLILFLCKRLNKKRSTGNQTCLDYLLCLIKKKADDCNKKITTNKTTSEKLLLPV